MTTKITADNIQANAITVATIADSSITGAKIAANTITLNNLDPNVVTQIAGSGVASFSWNSALASPAAAFDADEGTIVIKAF